MKTCTEANTSRIIAKFVSWRQLPRPSESLAEPVLLIVIHPAFLAVRST